MEEKYEKIWKKLYRKLKALDDITAFHGLIFKNPKKISIKALLEYMEELEGDAE
jgi:hypothetical protein